MACITQNAPLRLIFKNRVTFLTSFSLFNLGSAELYLWGHLIYLDKLLD